MIIVNRNPSELIAAEYNPRTLNDAQFEAISDSLKRFGFAEPILVNKHPERLDIIIGGHQRTKVAKSLGMESVPTVELSLTLDKEKELNIRLNKNTGDFDMEALNEFFEVDDLIEWGFSKDDFEWLEADEVEMPNLGDGSDAMIQTMTFTVSTDQNELIMDALSKAGAELDCIDAINENSNGNKLAALCRRFIND